MQHTHSMTNHKHPDYNLHMPKLLTYPVQVCMASIGLGVLLYLLFQRQPILAAFLVGVSILFAWMYLGLFTFLKRITNLEHRLKARDRFLDEIPWRGDEMVLDVGSGNGILIMGAARRLTTGKGIGIETWTNFAGDSRYEAFLENAKIEMVADRTSLQNEDVRRLSYADESFDIIISGLTIHHLGFDTEQGITEMIRVLKPGGWMGIYDEPSTIFYSERLMRKHGLQVRKKTSEMIFGVKPHLAA